MKKRRALLRGIIGPGVPQPVAHFQGYPYRSVVAIPDKDWAVAAPR